MPRLSIPLVSLYLTLMALIACGSDSSSAEQREENNETVTLTLLTHDSFAISEGVFEAFHEQTGIRVEVLTSGDVGSLLSLIHI